MTDRDRLPIFDELDRLRGRPALYAEPTFTFLNRIGGSYWDDVRQLLQEWADHLTSNVEYSDIRSRIRSRDNEQHRSALLELYLHESLLRAGYEVTVHPKIEGSSRHPDFLATGATGAFYLEATAPSKGKKAITRERRNARLCDVLDRVRNPNFMLQLQDYTQGERDASASKLKRDIERWLDTLDPDQITYDNAPALNWSDEGWHVSIRPIPIKPERRGPRPGGRAIGISGPARAASVDNAPTILRALEAKRRAYGQLQHPYVVAIGTDIFGSHQWHVRNALYGPDVLRIGADQRNVTRAHEGGGFYSDANGWRNAQVSAVLTVNSLSASKPTASQATLWKHPGAAQPLTRSPGFAATTVELLDAELIETPAPYTVAELFGLSEPWPPGDPWPDDAAA